VVKGKGKGRYSSSWEPHLRAMGRHLPYGITQCYLRPDTSERAPPNLSHTGWCWIYPPLRDGRLSWPSWLDSTPAGSRTSDISITSPTPNHCTPSGSGRQTLFRQRLPPTTTNLITSGPTVCRLLIVCHLSLLS